MSYPTSLVTPSGSDVIESVVVDVFTGTGCLRRSNGKTSVVRQKSEIVLVSTREERAGQRPTVNMTLIG